MNNKLNILLMSSLLMLSGCTKVTPNTDYTLDLNVACPSGAPAIALANYLNDSHVEINADASAVLSYIDASSNKDIVIAPTNALVAKVIKAGAPFKIAATITFGNLYLLSLNNDENNTLDNTDYVVSFQQNQLPDKLFKYVYGSELDVHYVSSAADARDCAASGVNIADNNHKVNYVLLAEPAIRQVLKANPSVTIYSDLQALYSEKANVTYFTQASIFVRTTVDTTKVNKFLSQIEKDIKSLLSNPNSILDKGITDEQFSGKFMCPKAFIVDELTTIDNKNKIGLNYRNAFANKESIDAFLVNLGFLPSGATSEEVYYK